MQARAVIRKWAAATAVAMCLAAADVPNLTGTWRLNVEKSSWGKKTKPVSVVVTVQHDEPQLKYSGKIAGANGEESSFEVTAAVDSKPYPVTTSYGPGKITFKRVNPYTVSSVFQSDDGKYTEDATTAISNDGKKLTRRLHLKSPDGTAIWTEVYEKQ